MRVLLTIDEFKGIVGELLVEKIKKATNLIDGGKIEIIMNDPEKIEALIYTDKYEEPLIIKMSPKTYDIIYSKLENFRTRSGKGEDEG